MRTSRFLRRARAALVIAFIGTAGQAQAIACADPVTYLYVCCPKPCQINDAQGIVQNVLKEAMEVSKLTSMVSQLTAWKDQLSQFGQTLNMINSLITQLFGLKGAAFSSFSAPTLAPAGLTGNPLNIGQMAGQVANLFFKPGATQADEYKNTATRSGMVSAGYLESVASGVNGRTVLATAATEFRDLTKVVNNAASSDTGGSRDENDVNVHTDLAAMNQTRLALLKAAQNQINVANVMLSTDAYSQMGRMGVDNNANRSSWTGSLSTGDIQRLTPALTRLAQNASDLDARTDLVAEIGGSLLRNLLGGGSRDGGVIHLAQAKTDTSAALASPYGGASAGYAAAASAGFTDPGMAAATASSTAFLNYDNLMERAVQVHNAATAYVSMMGTIQLNQETIALYNLTLQAAAAQRQVLIQGLGLFYNDPQSVFSQMAIQAVGTDGMSGTDPWQWGDSVTQQLAAKGALNNITAQLKIQPSAYGSMTCQDVWRHNKWVAQFTSAPAQEMTPALQAIYANPDQISCGALINQWLSQPAAPLYSSATDTSALNLTSADLNQPAAVKQAISDAALQSFLSDSNNTALDPNFIYWIYLTKQGIWMKDYASHATDVINNTRTQIIDLQANTNDPSTTLVMQTLPGLGPVDVTSASSVQGQISTLLNTASMWRGQVDPGMFNTESVSLRDAQLKAAAGVIQSDIGYKQWASTAPAMDDVACATQQCWGVSDSTWTQPATVMGASVGAQNPSASLPVVPVTGTTVGQPAADQAMSYCATLSVNTDGKSFASCPVQGQESFIPTALSPPPFGTGIGILR